MPLGPQHPLSYMTLCCIPLLRFSVLFKRELLEVTEDILLNQECTHRMWHTWQAFKCFVSEHPIILDAMAPLRSPASREWRLCSKGVAAGLGANPSISGGLWFLICAMGTQGPPPELSNEAMSVKARPHTRSCALRKDAANSSFRIQQLISGPRESRYRIVPALCLEALASEVPTSKEASQRKTSVRSRQDEEEKVDSDGQHETPEKLDPGGQGAERGGRGWDE